MFQDLRRMQFTAYCRIDEFVVWNAAPEEERQPGSEGEIAEPVTGIGCDARGILLYAKEELGADQHCTQGHFDAGIEAALRAGFLVKFHRDLKVGIRNRSAVSAAHEGRENAFGAGVLLVVGCRPAHKNATA